MSEIKPYKTAWEAVRDFENGVPQLWRDQEGGVDWERREAGWETGDMVRYYPEFAPVPAGWGESLREAEPKEVRCEVELDDWRYMWGKPFDNELLGLNECWDFPKCLGVEIRDSDGNEFVVDTPDALWNAISNGDVPTAVLMEA